MWPVPFWRFECGALFVLLQSAATDEGLATGFSSPALPEELAALKRLAELPDDVEIAGVMTLGHGADDPAVRSEKLARRRKPTAEMVTRL